MILSGKDVASQLYEKLKQHIQQEQQIPCLGAILVGNNPASLRYIGQKKKFAEHIGMKFHLLELSEDITEEKLLEHIQEFNSSKSISGYIVQLPLPKHIDEVAVIEAIDPAKDADGFHPINQGKILIGDTSGLVPCTPAGIMEILRYYNIPLSGKHVCIIGRSNIVGKPLACLCINAGATVISCNSKTPDISQFTQQADIIIVATGQAELLRAHMVNKDAIVIDVGFSVIEGKILGDANTQELLDQGNSVTPVPGGVGPMTVAMLLSNTYKAFCQSKKQ